LLVNFKCFFWAQEFGEKHGRIAIDSMKQLEYFINSSDGQKLIMELKDSSFMTILALPYIVNPQEDKSVSQIFSIDWLEQLTVDLEKFVQRFFQVKIKKLHNIMLLYTYIYFYLYTNIFMCL
jgi:hypothetical protein